MSSCSGLLRGEVGDNLKEKTLFSLIFYGDTAYTNLFKLFLNYKASSERLKNKPVTEHFPKRLLKNTLCGEHDNSA